MLDVLEIKQTGILEEEQRGVLRMKDDVKLELGWEKRVQRTG